MSLRCRDVATEQIWTNIHKDLRRLSDKEAMLNIKAEEIKQAVTKSSKHVTRVASI